jgi:hypothetical protein
LTATASDGDGADLKQEESPEAKDTQRNSNHGSVESVLPGALFGFLSQSPKQSEETPLPGVEIFQVIDASAGKLRG